MHLIKISAYISAVVILVGALASGYQVNAWASDIEDIRYDILLMEQRSIKTDVFRESAKDAKTDVEARFQRAMVRQLTQDLEHVNKKLEKMGR